ncbi:MAG: M20/M25/M40 family metallo-hydrolase [Candidatus Zixiibacteriota bacterium]
MLKKSYPIALAILLLLFSTGFAGDLYLLKINSTSELDIVRNLVEYAHGQFDNKFIVELSKNQASALEHSLIEIESLRENIDLANNYLLARIHSGLTKSAIDLNPIIANEQEAVAELTPAGIDIVKKEGYMAIPLENLQTPFFYHSKCYSIESPESVPSDTLADLVVQDSLYSYDTRLEAFQTRLIYSDSILAARDWLVAKFQSFGYTDVTTQLFYHNGTPCYNVICYKEGTTEADKLVVIGGHYDSINFQNEGDGMTFAPGADDNASGTSTVLEIARILSQMETKKSYYFCAFSAEEVGLVGAYAMASYLSNSGEDVECMLNFDMVAYTEDEFDNIEISSGSNRVYADVLSDAATRVTGLIPEYIANAGSSDHAAFNYYGFLVGFAIESDFNYPGWHTDLDLSSRLDFDYFEQAARMGIAAVGHIDNAPHQSPIENIYDIGDGQSVKVVWGDCDPTYTYSILMGTSSGDYEDTLAIGAVPPCEYVIDGLTEGRTYYFGVLGTNVEGFDPLYIEEAEGESYVIPRVPQGVIASPEYQQISISWKISNELDLNHYQILRRPFGLNWEVLEANCTDTFYVDYSPLPHVQNEYRIIAVDNDLNHSDSSAIVSATAATLDLPLLFVDETSAGGINPSESAQEEFYINTLFSNYNLTVFHAESSEDKLTRSLSGQHKNLIWLDDDLTTQVFSESEDTVGWYLNFNTNFCLAGWQTISWLTGNNPLPSGHFIRETFQLSQVTDNPAFDFIGAYGQNGWPDLQTNNANIFSGLLPNIPRFAVLPGAEVIYTYNSNVDDPAYEGQPCGVMYDNGQGKSIVLAFPIIQLKTESAIALISKIIETFGIEVVLMNGDANNDGGINLLDITFIISYLYKGGSQPPILNQADANGNCNINILDITYLISYLYKGGPEPIDGCAE